MHPLLQLSLTLLILLLFMLAVVLIVGLKIDLLLRTINKVLPLEVRDTVGKTCLVGLTLIAALFLVCLYSDEAIGLARPFLKSEVVLQSINLNMFIVLIVVIFMGNLIALSILTAKRRKR